MDIYGVMLNMNNTLAKDHQLPVNLKTTKGRQAPLCAQQECVTADVELPLGVELRQRYIRPPIRSRECCGGPTTTENVPYFTAEPIIPDPPPPPPILRHLQIILEGDPFSPSQSVFNIYGVPASGNQLVLILTIQIGNYTYGEILDITDSLVAISGYETFIGYAAGYIPDFEAFEIQAAGVVVNLDDPEEVWGESFEEYIGAGTVLTPVYLAPLPESMENISITTFIISPE